MRRFLWATAGSAILTLAVAWWFWRDRPRPIVGASHEQEGLAAFVHLTVSELRPQVNEVVGSVTAELGIANPASLAEAQRVGPLDSLVFKITTVSSPHQETTIGETDKPMKLEGLGLRTQGDFRWQVEPVRGAVMYPFDRYVARMRPEILGNPKSAPDSWLIFKTEAVDVDFSGVNFTTVYQPGSEQGTWFAVTLERPLWLRTVAIAALGLLIVWAWTFPFSPKPAEPASLLGLFSGVFALRSLLSGAPVFPSFIDYLSILLFLYVIAVLLARRAFAPAEPQCPFCGSALNPKATVCAACTRTLPG